MLTKFLVPSFIKISDVKRNSAKTSDFTSGTFRDVQKVKVFLARRPFESFSNIRRNRYRRSAELILQAKIASQITFVSDEINLFYEGHSLLPNDQIFKATDRAAQVPCVPMSGKLVSLTPCLA